LIFPINEQLIIFLSGAVVTILLFRKWVKKIVWSKKFLSEIEDELIGKTGKAEIFYRPG
jgi:membrane protein implicated in regulation of membrane protease activity